MVENDCLDYPALAQQFMIPLLATSVNVSSDNSPLSVLCAPSIPKARATGVNLSRLVTFQPFSPCHPCRPPTLVTIVTLSPLSPCHPCHPCLLIILVTLLT